MDYDEDGVYLEPDDEDYEDEDEDEDDKEDEEEEIDKPDAALEEDIDKFDNITVVVIDADERRTDDMMSLYEYTAVIGIRAQQIANGDPPQVIYKGLTSALDISKKEIDMGVCPCIIEREVMFKNGMSYVEHWRVSELKKPMLITMD